MYRKHDLINNTIDCYTIHMPLSLTHLATHFRALYLQFVPTVHASRGTCSASGKWKMRTNLFSHLLLVVVPFQLPYPASFSSFASFAFVQ